MPYVALALQPTLLVQLALVVLDKRTEERLLLAGQWLRHGDGRVRCARRVIDSRPSKSFRSELRNELDSTSRPGRGRLGGDSRCLIDTMCHSDTAPSASNCGSVAGLRYVRMWGALKFNVGVFDSTASAPRLRIARARPDTPLTRPLTAAISMCMLNLGSRFIIIQKKISSAILQLTYTKQHANIPYSPLPGQAS